MRLRVRRATTRSMNPSARARTLFATVAIVLAATGCDQKSAPEKAAADTDVTKAAASGSSKVAAPPPTASAAVQTIDIEGRSRIPTLEEWRAVKEVTVKGSSGLNCETKMVREWFRVLCRGKNDTGGKPTALRVMAGGGPGTYHYVSGGVVSLVTPFVEGTQLKAVFSWTDKSHELALSWPPGAPMPTIIGAFEGAKSPLDPPSKATAGKSLDYACKCSKAFWSRNVPPHLAEEDVFDCAEVQVNADCLFSYPSDCISYAKCALGEPALMPNCRPGHVRVLTNQCKKPCATNEECDGGATCKVAYDGKTKACFD